MPSLWKANKLKKANLFEEHRKHVEKITGSWARSLLTVAGVKVQVVGLENIPDEPCLFVSNHQGNFDIPLLIGHIPRKLSFISKIEVKKIPIVPLWMEHMGCIFMDRKNRRQAIKAIIDGAKKLEEGHSVVIFPEGTRSKGGPLGEFKKGSFKLATKSMATIVPVTINGSYLVMEANKNIICPAHVNITIGEPIRLHQENRDVSIEQLALVVEEKIKSNLTESSIKKTS